MLRYARMDISGEEAVYHIVSITALDGFPLQSAEIKKQFTCPFIFVDYNSNL